MLARAKELLREGGYTCVVCKDSHVYTSELRGVKPLVVWYEGQDDFRGASAADRVIGKATAYLYVLLGVAEVYAGVISKPALEVLDAHGIVAQYGTLVDNIINRQGDGICPFEAAVADADAPEAAYAAIRAKMREMHIELE